MRAVAELLLETLQSYRGRAYQLHEYVLMPDHFHILITPSVTLERAVQYIKGGFSYKVKKELQSSMEIKSGRSPIIESDVRDYRIHIKSHLPQSGWSETSGKRR